MRSNKFAYIAMTGISSTVIALTSCSAATTSKTTSVPKADEITVDNIASISKPEAPTLNDMGSITLADLSGYEAYSYNPETLITEDRVEEAINKVLANHMEDTDEPAVTGYKVTFNIVKEDQTEKMSVTLGDNSFGDSDEKLLGATVGTEADITDGEDTHHVVVQEVMKPAELTDDFVSLVSTISKTVNEYKDEIRDSLRGEYYAQADFASETSLMDYLAENSEVKPSTGMIEYEKLKTYHNAASIINLQDIPVMDYVQGLCFSSFEAYAEDVANKAEDSAKEDMIIATLADQYNITLDDSVRESYQEFKNNANNSSDTIDYMTKYLGEDQFDTLALKHSVLSKTLSVVEGASNG